jgi:hypothetical protein
MCQSLLAQYLVAKARHSDAERLYHRSLRTFSRLSRRLDDDRAYTIAGVSMADERMLKTYRLQWRAFCRLQLAINELGTIQRCMAIGAVLCAKLPIAANDP